jgi:hypothetical protein
MNNKRKMKKKKKTKQNKKKIPSKKKKRIRKCKLCFYRCHWFVCGPGPLVPHASV